MRQSTQKYGMKDILRNRIKKAQVGFFLLLNLWKEPSLLYKITILVLSLEVLVFSMLWTVLLPAAIFSLFVLIPIVAVCIILPLLEVTRIRLLYKQKRYKTMGGHLLFSSSWKVLVLIFLVFIHTIWITIIKVSIFAIVIAIIIASPLLLYCLIKKQVQTARQQQVMKQ